MSTQTTRGSLTREEIEHVISDIIGTMRVTIERYGSPSGDPSEVYGWIYDSEDEHPYRSETPDTLFDPEAEGWAPDEGGGSEWTDPVSGWKYSRVGEWHVLDKYDTGRELPAYFAAHPTTALVHEIIRLNGGDSE